MIHCNYIWTREGYAFITQDSVRRISAEWFEWYIGNLITNGTLGGIRLINYYISYICMIENINKL